MIRGLSHNLGHLYRKYVNPHVYRLLNMAAMFSHVASFFMIVTTILEIGFQFTDTQMGHVNSLYNWVWIIFLVDRLGHLVLDRKHYLASSNKFFGKIVVGLLIYTLLPIVFGRFEYWDSALLSIMFGPIAKTAILFFISAMDIVDWFTGFMGKNTNPSRVLAFSFLLLIGVGHLFLLMPESHVKDITWVDALFTATSAICVTGLTSVDISSVFTIQGQAIILVMIQVGGLGLMTITSFFALFFMGHTSLYNQMVIKDLVSSKSLSSLGSTLLSIIAFTISIESIGAFVLFFSIHGTLGMSLKEEVFFSVFHSVSAFCNAGFSTLDGGLANDAVFHDHNAFFWVLSFLIMLGSIGYPILKNVWDSLFSRTRNGRRTGPFDLNAKLVINTSLILVIAGFVAMVCFEWSNSMAGLNVGEKITQCFFNAVCPRTAGFMSVNLNRMAVQTIMIYMFLMWIGGASQSTAGGIKVNAFAVSILNIKAIITKKDHILIYNRQISHDSVRRANGSIIISLLIIASSVFIMSLLEPQMPLKSIVFECVSALSTVGSSLNLTGSLSVGGKIVITLLMFIGRVGMVTILQSFTGHAENNRYKLLEDTVIIS